MPALQISTSPNIAVLDSNIVVDMCAGKFFVDIKPSTFIGNGAALVKGAKVKITNPYNVEVKPYGASYDIAAPFTSTYSFAIPTRQRNYEYGRFQVFVEVTDADGTKHTVSKVVITCEPDLNNKSASYRNLHTDISGVCKDGKVYVSAENIPAYRGLLSTSTDTSLSLQFPTSSGIPKLLSTHTSFSAKLFEGVYKVSGEVCAHFYAADSVTYKIRHKVLAEKMVRCRVNTCSVYDRLAAFHSQITDDCDTGTRESAVSVTLDTLRLITMAEFAQECGQDATEYILELERLLGIPAGELDLPDYPYTTTQPNRDVKVEGVNVVKEQIGLTDVYTIDNYIYTVTVDPAAGGIITVAAPVLEDGGVKKQVISFSLTKAYLGIKNIVTNSADEKNYWASIIKDALSGLDISGLGINNTTYNGMTLKQFFQALLNKIKSCCDCAALITSHNVVSQGVNALVSWSASNSESVDVYLDGQFIGNVLHPDQDQLLMNVANGQERNYRLVPRCDKGTAGPAVTGKFTYLACPTIAAPNLNTNNANGVPCPYNLLLLVGSLPPGISVEWHTANNTLAQTLVPQPSAVQSGVFYAFAKDSNGCYSEASQVQVICQATSCTSPVNLSVSAVQGGFSVRFQSAAYPPPNNSYTVRRRRYEDADVAANYTTLPAPNFNTTLGRWEVLDTTAQINEEYTYVAISNCGATQPFVSYNFSHYPTCPIVTAITVTMS